MKYRQTNETQIIKKQRQNTGKVCVWCCVWKLNSIQEPLYVLRALFAWASTLKRWTNPQVSRTLPVLLSLAQ